MNAADCAPSEVESALPDVRRVYLQDISTLGSEVLTPVLERLTSGAQADRLPVSAFNSAI
jgi:FXSXX-COOH protein